jgi:uncharacterized membrane-anchored protein
LDSFQWRVPVEELEGSVREVETHELEQLAALGDPELSSAPSVLEGDAVTIDADATTVRTGRPDASETAAATRGDEKPEPIAAQASAAAQEPRTAQTPKPPGTRTKAESPRKAAQEGGSEASKKPSERTAKPNIFVAPHAPDDPGAEAGDIEDLGSMPNPFRA